MHTQGNLQLFNSEAILQSHGEFTGSEYSPLPFLHVFSEQQKNGRCNSRPHLKGQEKENYLKIAWSKTTDSAFN